MILFVIELPVGTWTSDYKAYLETLIEDKTKNGKKKKPIVKTYIDSCTDTIVEFTVKLHLGILPDLISNNVSKHVNQLEKVFKLTTTKKTSNMYLFNKEQQLRKYKRFMILLRVYSNSFMHIITKGLYY